MPRNKFNIVLPEGHRWEDEPVYMYNEGNPADFRWECKDCYCDFVVWVDEEGEVTTQLKKASRKLCTEKEEEKEELKGTTVVVGTPKPAPITIIHNGKTVTANSVDEIEAALKQAEEDEDNLSQYGWGL